MLPQQATQGVHRWICGANGRVGGSGLMHAFGMTMLAKGYGSSSPCHLLRNAALKPDVSEYLKQEEEE